MTNAAMAAVTLTMAPATYYCRLGSKRRRIVSLGDSPVLQRQTNTSRCQGIQPDAPHPPVGQGWFSAQVRIGCRCRRPAEPQKRQSSARIGDSG